MRAVTFQDVLDATKFIDMHHVQGTAVVICSLVTVNNGVVIGVGGEGLDVMANAGRARDAANAELARQLEAAPKEDPAVEGAASPATSAVAPRS